MKVKKIFFSLMALAALNSGPSWPAEGVISKVTLSENYCHLKFPSIREETLYWDRPVLKDATQGDIIDFYGPCDYDPLGKREIERQRRAYVFIQRRDTAGND
jgi:hypothetical protein